MKSKAKILLVDDEQKVLELIAYRLKLLGYNVITAGDGEEAITKFETESPDLIILDVAMPGIDGLTVCSRIRKMNDRNQVPILMLTARSAVEDVNKALSMGADDYIVKPYDPGVLQMKIQSHLSQRKIQTKESKVES